MDKVHNCLDLLCEYGYVEQKETLRETYESVIGLYNMLRDDPKMWEMVQQHRIGSLFQMEKQSGITGIELIKPNNVADLAVLNSVMRLMASEKGAEQPLDVWAKYRKDITIWYNEMREYGLNEEQIDWLAHHESIHDGIAESQESLMSLLQEERLGGNDLSFADKCRKAIAKKQGKLFDECEEFFFKNAEEKGCDMLLAHYVWDVLFKMQRGYSFNLSHTLSYSLIALQEMNLAYQFPIIFWDCACLINDAGGNETEENEEDEVEVVEIEYNSDFEDFSGDEEEEEDDDEEDDAGATKAKKKTKSTNYGKVASAIGKIVSAGANVAPPSINRSKFTFSPDVTRNTIVYGMSGITRIGNELIHTIMDNRPYANLEDFVKKVKINKPQMVNLIKCGAFDEFGDRIELMHQYINMISDTKKRITLQNMKMLIDFGLIPDEYDLERRVYNFNKYLKKMKDGDYYELDNIAFNFYSAHFDVDLLEPSETSEASLKIRQTKWDKIYQAHMDKVRPYVKAHNAELLQAVNERLTKDMWDKYCLGNISKWEMDSISCYVHEHELARVNLGYYGLTAFADIPSEPQIEKYIPIKGKMVPIYKLYRICGTVLDRNKDKKTVTLLTTDGVVTVKIYGVFEQYNKQISERGADGKKHVLRKSEFTRGNKIIVTGIRDGENEFRAKKYARTPYHLIETIASVDEDGRIYIDNRFDEVE